MDLVFLLEVCHFQIEEGWICAPEIVLMLSFV